MDILLILIVAAVIFGLLGGISLACLFSARPKTHPKLTSNSIRLWRPSRQRRESLKRATLQCNVMVATGVIDVPTRRTK